MHVRRPIYVRDMRCSPTLCTGVAGFQVRIGYEYSMGVDVLIEVEREKIYTPIPARTEIMSLAIVRSA